MTKQEFQKLTENHVLLLDGATGSNLMKAGMPRGVCTESWVLEHKDVIQSLQKAYIEAGSHIIYAPTFGGNRINLTMHGLEDQIEQINHTAGYSKEIAPEGVLVAGDITTTGKMMAPAGDMTYEKAFEVYQEQIGYLRDAGVDLIVAETMINIEETLAAVDACQSVCELPIICTVTVEADGSIFSGGNAIEAAMSWKLQVQTLSASTARLARISWYRLSAISKRTFPFRSSPNPMRECPRSMILEMQFTA